MFIGTAIDDSGTFLAVERLDIPTSASDLFLVDSTLPGTLFPVAAGSTTVFNDFPAVAVAGNRLLVTFRSNGDFSGNNADANSEIWMAGTAFAPTTPSIYCSAPDLPIPDRNNTGVSDVISVSAARCSRRYLL